MVPVRRELGNTEENWCTVVDGGTGITVSAFLFGLSLSKATVQAAVNELLSRRPFLRSQIVSVKKKLFFELSDERRWVLVEEVPNLFLDQLSSTEGDAEDKEVEADGGEEKSNGSKKAEEEEDFPAEVWLKIVDWELNCPFPKAKPVPVLEVHLHKGGLPEGSSLVVLRSHSSAADAICCGPIGEEFLDSLKEVVQKGSAGEGSGIEEDLLKKATLENGEDIAEDFEYYKSIEKSVPKGGADKPFWAHGTDVVGYGLASRKHAYLPFGNTQQQRVSHLIRASLSKDGTDRLLKACEERSTDLFGALTAAGLISVATFKNVGSKGEHYGALTLYNCRGLIDPKLPADSLGFYHSAISLTIHATATQDYWKFAAACTQEFQDGIQKRKHFTDMGTLNLLMVQALQHPNLTPQSTMRTAMLSLLHDPGIETTSAQLVEVLQLKDFASASSTHGVGPCFAMFPFLRNGALQLSFVYCSPLFRRQDIQTLVDSIVSHISV